MIGSWEDCTGSMYVRTDYVLVHSEVLMRRGIGDPFFFLLFCSLFCQELEALPPFEPLFEAEETQPDKRKSKSRKANTITKGKERE